MNRFVNGGLATNSELYMANVHVERRHDLSKHLGHLERLSTVTSSVAGSRGLTGSDYPHLRNNLNKRKMEEDRRAAIDHENMILLSKMRNIFSKGTTASNSGFVQPFEVQPRSLNQEARRRELERITRENLGIVHRIRSRKPNYSTQELNRQRQETEQHLRRISKHGQRRSDYFTSSMSGFSAASSTASSSSIRPFGSHGRPRRLRALDDPTMSNGLAASYRGDLAGHDMRSSRSSSYLRGRATTADSLPQYGDEVMRSSGSLPISASTSALNYGPISCDDLRPGQVRLRSLGGSTPSFGGGEVGGGGSAMSGGWAPQGAELPTLPPPQPQPRMMTMEEAMAAEAEIAAEEAAATKLQSVSRGRQARAHLPQPVATAAATAAPPSNYVLSPELKAEAERVFALADRDGSSTLDFKELANLRNSPEMAEKMMATIDTDRSGKVGRVEWIEYVTTQAAKSEKATWRLLEVYTKQIAEDKVVATTVTADTDEDLLQVAGEVTIESVEAALASATVTEGAYEPVLTTFGGRVVEVRSEAAEVLTQEPAPPQDVQSPTAASLKAAREASEPVPPLVDLSPDVRVERSPLPSEMRAAQRTSLQILIDGKGRGSILIGADVEGA